jgi:site-specific recombinase XerD
MAEQQQQVNSSKVTNKQYKVKNKDNNKIPVVYRVTSARLAPGTKVHYERDINRFFAYFHTKDIEPLKEYSKQYKQMIIDYIIHLRENERLSRRSIKLHLAAIRYFFLMIRDDEFPISWPKINDQLPPIEYVHRDRGYTVEEVQKMLALGCQGRLREKVVILLLTSAGGLRIGAIPTLKGISKRCGLLTERRSTVSWFIRIHRRIISHHVVLNVL